MRLRLKVGDHPPAYYDVFGDIYTQDPSEGGDPPPLLRTPSVGQRVSWRHIRHPWGQLATGIVRSREGDLFHVSRV